MSNDNTRGDVMNLHIKSVEELTKFLRLLQEREDPYAEAFKMAFEEDKEQYPLGKNATGKKNKDEEKNEEENPEYEHIDAVKRQYAVIHDITEQMHGRPTG